MVIQRRKQGLPPAPQCSPTCASIYASTGLLGLRGCNCEDMRLKSRQEQIQSLEAQFEALCEELKALNRERPGYDAEARKEWQRKLKHLLTEPWAKRQPLLTVMKYWGRSGRAGRREQRFSCDDYDRSVQWPKVVADAMSEARLW